MTARAAVKRWRDARSRRATVSLAHVLDELDAEAHSGETEKGSPPSPATHSVHW